MKYLAVILIYILGLVELIIRLSFFPIVGLFALLSDIECELEPTAWKLCERILN